MSIVFTDILEIRYLWSFYLPSTHYNVLRIYWHCIYALKIFYETWRIEWENILTDWLIEE